MTKHPSEKSGTTIKVRGGSRDVSDSYVNVAHQLGDTSMYWTLGSKNKSGFDYLNEAETPNRDSTSSVYTQLRTFTQFNLASSIEWQAGFTSGTNQQRQSMFESFNYNDEEDIESKDAFIWTKYNYEFSTAQFSHLQIYSENFKRTQKWNACSIEAPSMCGDFNSNINETKSEVEYQHTSIWSSQLRSVMGARLRLDEFESETYNDGRTENRNSSLFSNIEYRFNNDFVANMGGMYEKDKLNGEYFSPRIALNYSINPSQSIKLIYSEAIRSPNLFEQEGEVNITLNNVTSNNASIQTGSIPIYIPDYDAVIDFDVVDGKVVLPNGEGDGDLSYEKIYSHELSYFGLIPQFDAQLDIKIFYDELSGLISQTMDHSDTLTNENKLVQHGVEGQFKFQLNADNQVWFTWAYVESDDDFAGNNEDINKEQRLSAKKSGSLVWMSAITRDTQFAAAYYHVDNWNSVSDIGGYRFSRLDLNISQSVALSSGYLLKLQAASQYRLDDDPLLYSSNVYQDKLHAYVSAELNF